MAKNGLSPKQKKAVPALLSSRTITEAAAATGVGHRTITRWLAEDRHFKEALRNAQDQAIDVAVSRLAGAALEVADVLATIACDKLEKSSTRVAASRALLTNLLKLLEVRDIIERIDVLEAKVNATGKSD